MADPASLANLLCELLAENTASHEDVTDYTIALDDDRTFAVVSLEEQAIYKVTVEEARLVPTSNQDRDPASEPEGT